MARSQNPWVLIQAILATIELDRHGQSFKVFDY
jgi:hypothetical protein